jgi:hypothetical protein
MQGMSLGGYGLYCGGISSYILFKVTIFYLQCDMEITMEAQILWRSLGRRGGVENVE